MTRGYQPRSLRPHGGGSVEHARGVSGPVTTVLDLGELRIDAQPRPSHFDRWLHFTIVVTAEPFGGTLRTIFTDDDLVWFADSLDALGPSGEAVLGGDRAAELRLTVREHTKPGRPASLSVECTLTPSGDDPTPSLRFVMHDVVPFASAAARSLRQLADTDP